MNSSCGKKTTMGEQKQMRRSGKSESHANCKSSHKVSWAWKRKPKGDLIFGACCRWWFEEATWCYSLSVCSPPSSVTAGSREESLFPCSSAKAFPSQGQSISNYSKRQNLKDLLHGICPSPSHKHGLVHTCPSKRLMERSPVHTQCLY